VVARNQKLLPGYLATMAFGNLASEVLHLPLYSIWRDGTPGQQAFRLKELDRGGLPWRRASCTRPQQANNGEQAFLLAHPQHCRDQRAVVWGRVDASLFTAAVQTRSYDLTVDLARLQGLDEARGKEIQQLPAAHDRADAVGGQDRLPPPGARRETS
jgi:hypothetical protein